MYARSTTIQARPDAVAAGTAYLRGEVMPTVLAVPGCVGLSMLTDASTGRCIVSSAWESTDALRSSADAVGPMRQAAIEHFEGTLLSIETWDIAVLHREHLASTGSCVRCTWMHGAPDMTRAIDVFKHSILPQAEEIDGFCSASLFVDRDTGRAVSAVAWDSEDAMRASRERAGRLRDAALADFGGQIDEVSEFDLAVSHLRVPELV